MAFKDKLEKQIAAAGKDTSKLVLKIADIDVEEFNELCAPAKAQEFEFLPPGEKTPKDVLGTYKGLPVKLDPTGSV